MSQSSIKPLLLHAHSAGPNPYKVAIALEILSLPYNVKVWDFGDAANGVKGSTFTAINPNGRVPALEDANTGVTVWESQAVIRYLIRTYDKAHKLEPYTSEQERATAEAYESLLISTLGPFQGQVNWFKRYSPTVNEQAIQRYEEQTYRAYGIFEGQLEKSGGKTIVAGGVSPADLHLYPWVHSVGVGKLSLDKYPRVQAWYDGIKERPEFKAAYEKIAEGEKA